jgi:hypothetical protein
VGCAFSITLPSNTLVTLSSPAQGQQVDIEVIQNGTGGWTATFPSAVKWPGGTPPTITVAAGAKDMVSIFVWDAVTPIYFGSFKQAFA